MTGAEGAAGRSWLHVRVEGRVQGVGFRWFVRETAVGLGLVGWVRNLADGSVEVSAAGEPAAVDALRDRLAAGPPRARVDRLLAVGGGAPPDGPAFEVLRDARG